MAFWVSPSVIHGYVNQLILLKYNYNDLWSFSSVSRLMFEI